MQPASRRFDADTSGTAAWLLGAALASCLIIGLLVGLKPTLAAAASFGVLLFAGIMLSPLAGITLFVATGVNGLGSWLRALADGPGPVSSDAAVFAAAVATLRASRRAFTPGSAPGRESHRQGVLSR